MGGGELIIYNAYQAGLFGHHYTSEDLKSIQGIDLETLQSAQTLFASFCRYLGERALHALSLENVIVTPEKISPDLVKYMATRVFGLPSDTDLALLSLPDATGYDLSQDILDNGQFVDSIGHEVTTRGVHTLSPRTITPQTIILAQQLQIHHALALPTELFPGRQIDGIYPTLGFVESHPTQLLNSKAANYLRQKELDALNVTDFAPEGDIAYNLEGIIIIIERLASSQKKTIIKADLNVDGMGNLIIDPNELVGNTRFIELEQTHQEEIILARLKTKRIPVGQAAPVVVQELIKNIMAQPSFEVYSPPKTWGDEGPVGIYYDCEMIIEGGGFAGSIVPNPLDLKNGDGDISDLAEYGIQKELINRRQEYSELLERVRKAVLAFARNVWADGYVGINDADIVVYSDSQGNLQAKIVEYNYSRETGGTATYNFRKRLGRRIGQNVNAIGRDTILGTSLNAPLISVINLLDRNGVGFKQETGGAIILGHKVESNRVGKIMSLVIGRNLKEAVFFDRMLRMIVADPQEV